MIPASSVVYRPLHLLLLDLSLTNLVFARTYVRGSEAQSQSHSCILLSVTGGLISDLFNRRNSRVKALFV